MKPIKNSIPIRELQTLLRQWRRKGLTEGALLKVLELYLGLPNYMNEQGVYPVHFFYDLAASLRFRTAGNMLDAVRNIEMIGNDSKQMGVINVPTMSFSGMELVGN